MKKMMCVAAAVLMTAATIQAQRGAGFTVASPAVPLERDLVKGAPYSAELVTEHVQTLGDGNRIVQKTTGRVYRDSQGRVRREEDRPAGGVSISIVDAVAGVTYTLDPVRKTARQMKSGPLLELSKMAAALENVKRAEANAEAAKKTVELAEAYKKAVEKAAAANGESAKGGRGGPTFVPEPKQRVRVEVATAEGGLASFRVVNPGEDQVEERLTDRVIEGVLASGVRRTRTIPAGAIGNEQPIKIVSEEWRSPELQVLVMTDRTDPQTGRTTYRLLRINRADPDPLLFQVPGDYTLLPAPGIGARTGGAGGRGPQ